MLASLDVVLVVIRPMEVRFLPVVRNVVFRILRRDAPLGMEITVVVVPREEPVEVIEDSSFCFFSDGNIFLCFPKFLIFFLTIDRFKFTPETSFRASMNMTQISEFGLILTGLAVREGFIASDISGFISLVAIFTMGTSAYLIRYKHLFEKKFETILEFFDSEEKKDISIDSLEDHVVVIGYDTTAKRICELLSDEYDILVIDRNPENTDELARSDYRYVFGDFKHGEIREGANLEEASFILCFSDERTVNMRVLEDRVSETIVFTKTDSFDDASEFYELGADYVIVENMLSGNRVGEYLELYLEDKELFKQEIKSEKEHIEGEDLSQK